MSHCSPLLPLPPNIICHTHEHKRSEKEKADPELFAENVRTRMALALGVPASSLSADDIALTGRAARRKYPVDHATLGVFQFRQLGVKARHLLPLVDAFIDLDSTAAGVITPEVAAGVRGDTTTTPALLALVHACSSSKRGLDMHDWMLLHLLLAGRAPGGWDTTAAALREAADTAGIALQEDIAASSATTPDAFVRDIVQSVTPTDGRGTAAEAVQEALKQFPTWAKHEHAEWRRLLRQWLPSTDAMDRIWAE